MSTLSRLAAKDRIGFCSASSSSMAALMQVVPDVLSARTDIRADLSGVTFSICWGPRGGGDLATRGGALPVLPQAP